jgi:hypothetical protein
MGSLASEGDFVAVLIFGDTSTTHTISGVAASVTLNYILADSAQGLVDRDVRGWFRTSRNLLDALPDDSRTKRR